MKVRALVLVGGLCVFCAVSAAAQTPFSTSRVSGAPLDLTAEERQAAAPGGSAANAWLGAQLGYKFGNSDALGENLLVSASVIHEIPLAGRSFHLPVISNFANLVNADTDGADALANGGEEAGEDKLKTLLLGSSGIRAGLYPYKEVMGLRKDDFKFVVHGEASWKINGFKQEDSDETNYVNQLRFAAGFEVAIGEVGDDSRPLTLSVTPVITRFDPSEFEKVFKERKSKMSTLEVVAVLPIAPRAGVLFEYVRGDVNSFRAGVIIARSGEKKE